ncbi:hypothetical protein ABE41_004650 [Fictibacillus arsenicus]|uniref:Uncharacterized protein n=1 Tax=Fictibacillus arsenicus TaxID=255247 RepID=A0A1B1Z1I6_9BACL|nr:hypothetical protein ABE41_004650 [Fictibacillus arsenicus]
MMILLFVMIIQKIEFLNILQAARHAFKGELRTQLFYYKAELTRREENVRAFLRRIFFHFKIYQSDIFRYNKSIILLFEHIFFKERTTWIFC